MKLFANGGEKGSTQGLNLMGWSSSAEHTNIPRYLVQCDEAHLCSSSLQFFNHFLRLGGYLLIRTDRKFWMLCLFHHRPLIWHIYNFRKFRPFSYPSVENALIDDRTNLSDRFYISKTDEVISFVLPKFAHRAIFLLSTAYTEWRHNYHNIFILDVVGPKPFQIIFNHNQPVADVIWPFWGKKQSSDKIMSLLRFGGVCAHTTVLLGRY